MFVNKDIGFYLKVKILPFGAFGPMYIFLQ